MYQVLQNLNSGKTELVNVPAPSSRPEHLLIKSACSLISLGTEKMLLNFGRANLIQKALKHPERVRTIIDKIKSDGLITTLNAVRSKLDQPIPMGYCNVGVVLDVATHHDFKAGERVISNGPHAEVVLVKNDLCAKIPNNVKNDVAVFTPLAAIALQGINLMDIRKGDKVVVMGLGLIGQLAVRLLRAKGCAVFGLDLDTEKCDLATKAGATCLVLDKNTDPTSKILSWTNGEGVSGVLICASTHSSALVNQAAQVCRSRAKVVLVGVVGLQLNRADFYQNEVCFQVSNSYGSRNAADPFSVQKNFNEVLRLMSEGLLNVDGLISQKASFNESIKFYNTLHQQNTLGLLLEYNNSDSESLKNTINLKREFSGELSIGILGTGNFSTRTLLPCLKKFKSVLNLRTLVSANGLTAAIAADKYGSQFVSTDEKAIFNDPQIKAVFITTRHDLHAQQTIKSLEAGQSVWVEKPLALTEPDLEKIITSAKNSGKILMVGFNRRFAPLALHVKKIINKNPGPKIYEINVNAGTLPINHWTLDSKHGGGRIVGEACHFVDLLRYFTGSKIKDVVALERGSDGQDAGRFKIIFEDGSLGFINYLTHLSKDIPKERIIITAHDWSVEIDNWRKCKIHGLNTASPINFPWQPPKKGHHQALEAFFNAVRLGEASPIPLDEIIEVSRWSIRMQAMTL